LWDLGKVLWNFLKRGERKLRLHNVFVEKETRERFPFTGVTDVTLFLAEHYHEKVTNSPVVRRNWEGKEEGLICRLGTLW